MSGKKPPRQKRPRQVGHPAFEYHDDRPARNLAEDDHVMLACEEWQVLEWHPLENGEGKPTQVHIVITPGSGPLDEFKFIMRLKSKAACDAMIETLQRHRDNVWGVS